VSLTHRLKSLAREYQASDGTTYLLQPVNDAKSFLADGSLPRILASLEQDDFKRMEGGMTNDEFFALIRQKPNLTDVMTVGVGAMRRQLEQGLVGELTPEGKPIYYRWVDKPLHALEEGEVNVDFIPDRLAQELIQQIQAIGRPPAVEGRDVTTFPGQQNQPASREAGGGNGEAAV
jgi:hypothetical protein